ncbi:MAG TPA: hypothetical protein VGE21_04565 [Flavobacteriales bacterium]
MRRPVPAIIIVLAYTLVLMPDAVRLPTLIGHFLDHRTRTPEMGFVDFLELHYADQEHQENGDATHEHLPFHHHHTWGDNCGSIALLQVPALLQGASHAPVKVFAMHGDDDTLAGHRYGLIQPPRC